MATTTVSDLIARAAAAADMEDNFVTETQWLYWANVENRALAVMVARLGFPYRQSDESITMTGALQYSLDEPLSILAVFFVEADGSYTKLDAQNPFENQGLASREVGDPEEYNVIRNTGGVLTFSFFPNPASGTVIVRTIPYPDTLVVSGAGAGEATSVDFPLNWEERIVLGMARRALAKEETMNPFIEQQIREIEGHIETSAWDYLMSDAPVIRDVRGNIRNPRSR